MPFKIFQNFAEHIFFKIFLEWIHVVLAGLCVLFIATQASLRLTWAVTLRLFKPVCYLVTACSNKLYII